MMWLLWKVFPLWLYMSYSGVSNFFKICQKMVCQKEIHQHFFVVLWVVCDGLHHHIFKWCVIFDAVWLSQHWMPSPIWLHILIHTNTHQLVFGCWPNFCHSSKSYKCNSSEMLLKEEIKWVLTTVLLCYFSRIVSRNHIQKFYRDYFLQRGLG